MHQHHSQSQKPITIPIISKEQSLLYEAFYDENRQLGFGKFGEVYKASLNCAMIQGGALTVQKRRDLVVKTSLQGREKYLNNEINILRQIPDHPNIVRLIGASDNNKYCFLEKCMMGFARKTSDYEIFRELPVNIQFAIFHNMLTSHLHLLKHDIKNMDVHLMNWLVGYDGHIKMIDFGDAYNIFQIPMKHLERYQAKITTKDPVIQIDILTRRLSRRCMRKLMIALTRAIDLSFRQTIHIYFINGGVRTEEYKEHFFKLHAKYTRRRKEKFLNLFAEIQNNHTIEALKDLNAQLIKEIESILRSEYLWSDRASPEEVKEHFLQMKAEGKYFDMDEQY